MKLTYWFVFYAILLHGSKGFSAPDSTLSPTVASAKIQGFTITARDLTRDIDSGTVLLNGDVRIIYQQQYFEADTVTLDLIKKQAQLKGHVKVQTPQYQIGGEEVRLDYEAGQGLIFFGYVQSNNIRFQGNLIEKLNDKEFFVVEADYTTCSNCPATWSFQGSQIKAELGGYAYLKNTTFKIGQVPVFWLPYLAVPLKSDRQTGLLPPEIGHIQNRGLIISESLFYALNRSEDYTFTLKNYQFGGLKPLVEYRYALSPLSYGTAHAAVLRDSVFATDERLNKYRGPDDQGVKLNRWAVRSYNQYGLDANSLLRLQLSLVSDLEYPKDFSDEFINYSDPALENNISYSHQWNQSVGSISATYYRNLLSANQLESNANAVHRIPEIKYDSSLLKMSDLPLYWKLESSFTQFARSKPFDDISLVGDQKYASNNKNNPGCEHDLDPTCSITFDGNYDPSIDQIRTGQRANLKATVMSDTFNIGRSANISPSASLNETQYFFPVGESKFNARHFAQFDINSRTKFYRIYDDDYEITKVKYKHEIIPELQYTAVPWLQQQDHSFFGGAETNDNPNTSRDLIISDSDINSKRGIQYDFDDRVYDRNVISLSILNNIIQKRDSDLGYKTIMTFKVTQSYDFYQASKNSDQPLSKLAATFDLDLDHIKSNSQVAYSPYEQATNSITTLSYLNEQQQYFKIGLSSTRIEQKHDDISFAIGFVSPYVNILTGVIFDASAGVDNSKRLKRNSLITQLKPPGDCWAVNFYYDQKESVAGEWHFKFDFSWDGKPTKIIPPNELKIN